MPNQLREDFLNWSCTYPRSDFRSAEQAYLEDIIWPETEIDADVLNDFDFQFPDLYQLEEIVRNELANCESQMRLNFYMANFHTNSNNIDRFLHDTISFGPAGNELRIAILSRYLSRALRWDLTHIAVAVADIPPLLTSRRTNNWVAELNKLFNL